MKYAKKICTSNREKQKIMYKKERESKNSGMDSLEVNVGFRLSSVRKDKPYSYDTMLK